MVHRACMATFNGRQFFVDRGARLNCVRVQHTRRLGHRREVGMSVFLLDGTPRHVRNWTIALMIRRVASAKRRMETWLGKPWRFHHARRW